MDDFVAYPSRPRLAVMILGSVAFLALGLWMAGVLGPPPESSRYSSGFITLVGWVTIAFSVVCFVLGGQRFLDRREHLRIGVVGIRSTQWSGQTIPWSEIVDVTTWTLNRQQALVLHLRDPARFPGRGLAAMTAAANRSLTGGDISVSVTGTDRTFEDAILALNQFRPPEA